MAPKTQGQHTAETASSKTSAEPPSQPPNEENGLMTPVYEINTDNEAEASSKEDPNDSDYEQQTQRSKSVTTKPRTLQQRKKELEKLSKDDLMSRVMKIQDSHAVIKKKRTVDRKEKDAERKQRIRLRQDNKELVTEVEDLKAKCRNLRREKIQDRDKFLADLEEKSMQFAAAQEDWIAKIDESNYPALPDNILRDKFVGLLTRCKDWVREWYSNRLSPESEPYFRDIIERCVSDERTSAKELLFNKLSSQDCVLLRAMGFAGLSREMVHLFFRTAFFAGGRSRDAFENFYHSNLKDLKKAYSWRAETLRLSRNDLVLGSAESRNGTMHPEALDNFCASKVEQILDSSQATALRELKSGELMRRQTELVEICRGFYLLALELWCQKSHVDVMDDWTLFRTPFTMSSDYLKPHISMGMDEDDLRFHNVLPHAVLVPAIRVFGDSNGNNLEQEKILSRAIVLVYEEDSLDVRQTAAVATLHTQPEVLVSQSISPVGTEIRDSKKRKRVSEDNLSERSREEDVSSSMSLSTTVINETPNIDTGGQQAKQDQSLLTGVLEQVERGDTCDQARKQQHLLAQEKYDLSSSKPLDPSPGSSMSHNRAAGSDTDQTESAPECGKRIESPQDEHNSSVPPLERTNSNNADNPIALDDEISDQTQKQTPVEEDAEDTIRVVVAPQTAELIKTG